jgi:hypothetical protein
MRNHNWPKTLCDKLTIGSPVPSIVYVTEGKALKSGDWHFESTVLNHLPPNRSDCLTEIEVPLDHHVPRSHNDHHENHFAWDFVELESSSVDKRKGGCNMCPVEGE